MTGRNRGWGAPPPYADLHQHLARRQREARLARIRGFNRRVGYPALAAFGAMGLCAAAMTWGPQLWPQPQPEVYAYTAPFSSCAAARAAGRAPLYRGSPGYGPHLDRDNDGIACEPWFRFGFW
jgi:hypothetical protein